MEKIEQNRYVIKLGSSTVVDQEDNLKLELLDHISMQVSLMIDCGYEVAIVTSGAVACGRKRLGIANGSLVRKQELAAAGSTKLFSAWSDAFEKYGKKTVDHLLSEQDVQAISVGSPKWPLIEELVSHKYVPVINANDSVNTFELEQLSISADNDRLSAFVARLVNAYGLIMLTEAEGVWDQNRNIIGEVTCKEDLNRVFIDGKTAQGTGGMESKIEVASQFAIDGRSAWITGGHISGVLINILRGEKVATRIKMS